MKQIRRNDKNFAWSKGRRFGLALLLSSVACIGTLGTARAIDIPVENEDFKIRWDNTLRYTYAYRTSGQNSTLVNNANIDDGNRNFNVGTVSNRLDILSEADIVYKKDYGARLSGAFWYDQRYNSSLDNTSPDTSNHLVNGIRTPGMSNYADRYFNGPSGELLDAFVFGKFTIGNIPVNMKLGRHTVYWGESMLANGGVHGISYAQSSIDIPKALAQPSLELKELFRPRNQISMQVQPSNEFSIAANYYLEWEANRWPEPGTYLGFFDAMGNGSESITGFDPTTFRHTSILNQGDIEPRQAKDWGVSSRWSPAGLEGGTVGLYYRQLSDTSGQLNMRMGAIPVGALPNGSPIYAGPVPFDYRWSYASGIDLYGISFSKQVAGISIGSEISYRQNMPLWSNTNAVVTSIPHPANIIDPTTGASLATLSLPNAYPGAGETGGARGKTWHAVINFLNIFGKSPLYDTATGLAEFTWNRLQSVTTRADLFKWGNNTISSVDRATKDYIGGQINFEPTWYQVLPGMDLSMPLSGFMGLVGNSCVANGGTKDAGTYTVGFSADYLQKYKANLSYIGFFGPMGPTDSTGTLLNGNSSYTSLKDRNMVMLTVKTTF